MTTTATGVVPARRVSRERVAWTGFALCALALAAVAPYAVTRWRERPTPVESVKFSVVAPLGGAFLGGVPSVSPDGRQVAYVASAAVGSGANLIWIRSLDSIDARSLPGTDEAAGVFWSPDSRFVGFFAGGKLKKAELAGGAPQTVCTVNGSPRGGAWGRDDSIVFAQSDAGLTRVSANGGEAVPVTSLDAKRKDVAHISPNFLPDGRRFLFVAVPSSTVVMGSLDSPDTTPFLNADGKAVYSPPGYLLFLRQGTLMAQPFDAARGVLTGAATPIVDRVFYNSLAFNPGYSVSTTGVLSYRTGAQPPNEITILDRTGRVLGLASQPGDYRDIDVSPDGTKLIIHKHEDPSGGGLWLIDLARNTTSRFTFDASHNTAAHWSPDGRLAFISNRDGNFSNIYQKIASGAGADEVVFKADATVNLTDWSPDGKFLVFERHDPKMLSDIWVWSFADRKASLFLQTPAAEGQGRLSPDGKWMVYTSNETGRNEIYVQPFPPSGGKWQVSSSGGSEPRWRSDGKELFFLNSQGATYSMMSVDTQVIGAEFHPGIPTALFAMRMVNAQGLPRVIGPNTISQLYAVSRDGQRFFALIPQTDTEPVSITVLTNWTTLLKK